MSDILIFDYAVAVGGVGFYTSAATKVVNAAAQLAFP